MVKAILFVLAVAIAAASIPQNAYANAAYCNNNTNPRVFNGTTGLTVADNIVFEMDYKFPDAATRPLFNNQVFGVTVLSAGNNNSPYGNADGVGKATSLSVVPGVGFRIEATPSTDINGAAESVTIFYRDGLFSSDVGQAILPVPFDHKWHHVTFSAILTVPGTQTVPPTGVPQGANFRPGLIFALDGIVVIQGAVTQLSTIGLGTILSGTTLSSNTTGNANMPVNRGTRLDNFRINGRLIDSFENGAGTVILGTGAWPTTAPNIALQVGGLANWLVGNAAGQYFHDASGSTVAQSDGTARNSDFMQGSIFLNGTAVTNVVAADRSIAAADDLGISVDFRFPTAIAAPTTDGIAFSIVARLNGEKGAGSLLPANNAGGVECKVSVSANTGGLFRAEVLDHTAVNVAGTSLGVLVSTKAFNQSWHRLTFSLIGTTPAVSIDGVSLGAYGALSAPVAGITDGENFSIAVNPGTGGSAARNPRFDNINIASATNPAALGAAVAIDDFSTYIPTELAAQIPGMGVLNASAQNLRANPTAAVLADTPWINGQVVVTAGASEPTLFRMTSDNSTFGIGVNAVPGWTLY